MPIRFLSLLVLLCLNPLFTLQGQTAPKAAGDVFLQGNPFTYNQLLQYVGPLPHRRVIAGIEARKVDFVMTPAQSDALLKAGATKQIIEAIEKNVSTVENPVNNNSSSPAQRNSRLFAECQPAECGIFIDGQPLGFTINGQLSLAEISHRSIVLSFRKDGYITQEFTELLEPGQRTLRQVKLVPDEAFQSREGEKILYSVVQALGGESGLKAASSYTATGDVSIYTRAGESSEWSATIRYLAPDAVSFRLKGSGTEIQSAVSGKGYKANKGLEKSPLASEIDADIRLFRDFQLPNLISRLKKEKFKITSTEDRRGFVARTIADIYTVQLGADLLPDSIKYSSGSGLNAGVEVIYSNFSADSHGRIPRTLAIKLPDAARHGMEVRLTSVSPSAKLSERDFR